MLPTGWTLALQACFEHLLYARHCAWHQNPWAHSPVGQIGEACINRKSTPWVMQDRIIGWVGGSLNHVVGEGLSEWVMHELRLHQ